MVNEYVRTFPKISKSTVTTQAPEVAVASPASGLAPGEVVQYDHCLEDLVQSTRICGEDIERDGRAVAVSLGFAAMSTGSHVNGRHL